MPVLDLLHEDIQRLPRLLGCEHGVRARPRDHPQPAAVKQADDEARRRIRHLRHRGKQCTHLIHAQRFAHRRRPPHSQRIHRPQRRPEDVLVKKGNGI